MIVIYLPCGKICHHDFASLKFEVLFNSIKVPIGVLNKDESTTAGMIEILENYNQYVPLDYDGNPMTLILYCDGLSCERVEGAQRARINGADAMARLEEI